MNAQEEKFVNYWTERRKIWSWKTHSKKMFLNVVLPLAILIDLVNYFIIGDTAYTFFTFTHFFSVALNIIVLAVLIILGTGFASWNYNEGKYWGILRKNNKKLQ
jgi:hypothetical protein